MAGGVTRRRQACVNLPVFPVPLSWPSAASTGRIRSSHPSRAIIRAVARAAVFAPTQMPSVSRSREIIAAGFAGSSTRSSAESRMVGQTAPVARRGGLPFFPFKSSITRTLETNCRIWRARPALPELLRRTPATTPLVADVLDVHVEVGLQPFCSAPS